MEKLRPISVYLKFKVVIIEIMNVRGCSSFYYLFHDSISLCLIISIHCYLPFIFSQNENAKVNVKNCQTIWFSLKSSLGQAVSCSLCYVPMHFLNLIISIFFVDLGFYLFLWLLLCYMNEKLKTNHNFSGFVLAVNRGIF